jgi:hypothetical protein
MQRAVEHRRTQNFARGSHGKERLRICTNAAVSRAVTSSIPYHHTGLSRNHISQHQEHPYQEHTHNHYNGYPEQQGLQALERR